MRWNCNFKILFKWPSCFKSAESQANTYWDGSLQSYDQICC